MPIVGQTGLNGLVAFSPWFKRPESATAGIFSAYSIQMTSGSGIELEVALYHRNSEDTDSGSQVGSAMTASTENKIETIEITGLEEMLRYKYTLQNGDAGDWLHWAMPHPVFFVKKT